MAARGIGVSHPTLRPWVITCLAALRWHGYRPSTSFNQFVQFVATAVAEKLAGMNTATCFLECR